MKNLFLQYEQSENFSFEKKSRKIFSYRGPKNSRIKKFHYQGIPNKTRSSLISLNFSWILPDSNSERFWNFWNSCIKVHYPQMLSPNSKSFLYLINIFTIIQILHFIQQFFFIHIIPIKIIIHKIIHLLLFFLLILRAYYLHLLHHLLLIF